MEIDKFKAGLKEKVSSINETISDFKEEGRDKLLNSVNGLTNVIPLVAQTGYTLKSVNVELSLPPGITMQFVKQENISKEKRDEILEANKDNELLKSIVKALVMADEFHNKIKMGNLKMSTISISLSLPPKVSINFA